MATIQVEKLSKSFGKLTAVDELEFEIPTGETFGLLGPNGAGKTTSISMMIGLLKPTAGRVTIDNRSPTEAGTRNQIGLSPQSLSLYEELTARENLDFFASLYHMTPNEIKDRVAWALDFAGLTDRSNDRVSTFSGGMKRRLNLACALIHQPSVVLMDEPTVGVDPQSRNHLFDCIGQLQSEGLTIIYTTHYMQEAQRLCDRIAIVDHGKLLALDSVNGLIEKHGGKSSVVAEFKQAPNGQLSLNGDVNERHWQFESDRPMDEIAKASQQGLEFESLTIAKPDLEGVFLSLTGRRLRD